MIAIVAREHGVRSTFDPKRNTPLIDLGTVREMVAYIRDDLRRVPGLERATELLGSVLAEVEAAERRRLAPIPRSILASRLLPRRKH